ncbi:MAG TPA: Ig-like domain-containing protein, partial [Chryseosolibacter sp.]|nr:Ig-like domain-containing protein [Chryseosolibacter sp.]
MKTRVIPMLVTLVALLSCEESLQVDGPKIPETDKTVTVILSNIPAGLTGETVYLFTLDSKGRVYAIHEAEASEGANVQVAPVAGFSSFDIAAFIPASADGWSSKAPFTDGHYSRTTAVTDKEGVFVTKTWSSTTTLSSAPTTGLVRSIQAELYVNGSANPTDTDFTKGEIVTLDAAVIDNIRSSIASVEFFLDATKLESYTTTPYRF